MVEQDRRPKPSPLVIVLGAIVALAVLAVLVTQLGGGDDDDAGTSAASTETRDGDVVGDALPKLDDPADDPAIGTAAPVLNGETFAGDKITIGGKGPALVVFVAHWCPHCRREVPFLVSYFDLHGMPEGVDVYGVATSIDPSAPNYPPSKWLADENWKVPTLVDADDSGAAVAYGLSAFPYFVALNKDGVVVARTTGELEAPDLEALLTAARTG
jgi:thiol-disulfide isomerase/thioredoxin